MRVCGDCRRYYYLLRRSETRSRRYTTNEAGRERIELKFQLAICTTDRNNIMKI